MSFAGQVAVVTGASSGLGRSLARRLAGEGCKVGLVARRREALAELAEEIAREGGTAVVAPASVADRAELRTALHHVAATLGPVDLLVANAGVGSSIHLDSFDAEELEAMFRVNLFGVLYAIEAVLPEMLRRGRGHLAAVSSLGAYKGLPGASAYSASKAAVNVFLEGLRIQLRGRGIAVTTICPGFVRTPMTAKNTFPMPFVLEPEEAARRIVRALHQRRKVYNFPWPMTLFMKLSASLPDAVMAWLARKYDPDVM